VAPGFRRIAPDGVALRIADLETGRVLPCGEIGEVQVLSPSVMVGYLPEEATVDAFADGWYRSGDVGWLEPEEWVHLTDRSKR
jgi:long-chain acyl-CoA synthetase